MFEVIHLLKLKTVSDSFEQRKKTTDEPIADDHEI